MRNHLKHEFEQEQRQKANRSRLLPIEILCTWVFPHAFGSLSEALNVLLVCKDTLNLGKTEAFWRPFLKRVIVARVAWFRENGYHDLADTVQIVYQVFPPNMTVKDCVMSKFFFEEFPAGFPYAREISVERQSEWAMSQYRYRASCFKDKKPWAPPHNRVGEYCEISPMWMNRSVYLQRYCLYTVSGLLCGTYTGREYLFMNPVCVQVRGWKSSYTSSWYRLGVWRLERFVGTAALDPSIDRTSFVFEGKFSAVVGNRPKCLESTGVGKLWINGLEIGQFTMFNLNGLPDWLAHSFGFEGVDDPEVCFVLHLRTGRLEQKHRSYRLLEEVFEARAQLANERNSRAQEEDAATPVVVGEPKAGKKRARKAPKLQIAEYDYSDLSRASYVCRVPEGCFSADELASMFGIEGVVKFDQKHRIPAQIANFMSHRVNEKGQNEFLVRWQGYGEVFDTWEPEAHLGDRLAEARELFSLPAPSDDDDDVEDDDMDEDEDESSV